jgi:GTP cyclohydrolase I
MQFHPAEVSSTTSGSSSPKSELDSVDNSMDSSLSFEEERLWLELSRKRRRTTTTTKSSLDESSSETTCHDEVGKTSSDDDKLEQMTTACKTILKCIGEDPDREGLLKTPERWAKALLFMTSGYSRTAEEVLNNAIFSEDSHKEIVIVKNISIHSMCEHHMLPFTGVIHVGYIPNGKSKTITSHDTMLYAYYFMFMHVSNIATHLLITLSSC